MTDNNHNLAFWQRQISLSEWFQKIGHQQMEDFRTEDNEKRERLKVLKEIIFLPFDQPLQLSALEIAEGSANFQRILKERGDELCALRLIPLDDNLPKLRMIGLSIREVVENWFKKQEIDLTKYRAEFIPHPKIKWSAIFVVNQYGISGEVIADSHEKLTQGFYGDKRPVVFSYDFNNWRIEPPTPEVAEHIKKVVDLIKVVDQDKQKKIKDCLDGRFINDYLAGYFESIESEHGIWYVDYNRLLGNLLWDFKYFGVSQGDLKGYIGNPGYAKGVVKVINDSHNHNFETGEILVCDITTPDFVPLMKKAAAIITDRGGVLSHAAIIARELGKPCIVGTQNATQILKTGDYIEVDGNRGIVKIL